MTDATLKAALRELREDLERLRVDLENAIANIVGIDEYVEDDILTKEADGSISVDAAELRALLESLDDASEEAAGAFKTFDQEADRAWRRFRQSLVVHNEMGASP
jgi:hypothetical protein